MQIKGVVMEKIDISQLELNPFLSIGKDTFLIAAGNADKWNAMTAGWGGMGYMWGKPVLFTFVRESRYTLEFINANEEFSVSFFPPEKKAVLSFCGSHSGRDTDKMKQSGLTALSLSSTVGFEEANLTFVLKKASCHLVDKSGILDEGVVSRWYPEGDWHYMFIGFIEEAYVQDTDITVVDGEII